MATCVYYGSILNSARQPTLRPPCTVFPVLLSAKCMRVRTRMRPGYPAPAHPCPINSLVPRPHPQECVRKFRDSHVTAVAPFEQRSLCIRLKEELLLIYSSVSTVCVERRLPAAYWASSRRYGYRASEL